MSRNNIRNLTTNKQSFDSIYRGVVEDNKDPLKMGRLKVRISGIHPMLKVYDTGKDTGIATANLPWSEPCYGLVEGSISGFGAFSVPLQGSHVFIFFENGNWNSPRHFATVPGLPVSGPNILMGFGDPSGVYPLATGLLQPDINKLARGVIGPDSIVTTKNLSRTLGCMTTVSDASGPTWNEPVSPYNASYPENIVVATHSNIVIELDNTSGHNRVHVYHPSGSYVEIADNGDMVIKNNGDKFELTRGDRNVTCANDRLYTGNKYLKVTGNTETEAINNTETYTGDTMVSAVNDTETYSGNRTVNAVIDTETYTGDRVVSAVNDTETYSGNRTVNAASNTETYTGDRVVSAVNDTETYSGNRTVNAASNTETYGGVNNTSCSSWTITTAGEFNVVCSRFNVLSSTTIDLSAGGGGTVASVQPGQLIVTNGILRTNPPTISNHTH